MSSATIFQLIFPLDFRPILYLNAISGVVWLFGVGVVLFSRRVFTAKELAKPMGFGLLGLILLAWLFFSPPRGWSVLGQVEALVKYALGRMFLAATFLFLPLGAWCMGRLLWFHFGPPLGLGWKLGLWGVFLGSLFTWAWQYVRFVLYSLPGFFLELAELGVAIAILASGAIALFLIGGLPRLLFWSSVVEAGTSRMRREQQAGLNEIKAEIQKLHRKIETSENTPRETEALKAKIAELEEKIKQVSKPHKSL